MILWTLLISLIAIISDVVIKQAADTKNNWYLYLGMALYAGDAVLWWWVYRYAKFSTVAIIYALFTILLSIIIGVLFFKETITMREIIGIILGIIAVSLLSRFGE